MLDQAIPLHHICSNRFEDKVYTDNIVTGAVVRSQWVSLLGITREQSAHLGANKVCSLVSGSDIARNSLLIEYIPEIVIPGKHAWLVLKPFLYFAQVFIKIITKVDCYGIFRSTDKLIESWSAAKLQDAGAIRFCKDACVRLM